MYDSFWFSDFQRARIAPLLPTDMRGRKRVDDRPVPSGIVHALRRGAVAGPTAPISTGRRRRSATASSAGLSAVYGKVSSALRQALRIRLDALKTPWL